MSLDLAGDLLAPKIEGTPISGILKLAETRRKRIARLRDRESGETRYALEGALQAQDRFIGKIKSGKTIEDLEDSATREMQEIDNYRNLAHLYVQWVTGVPEHAVELYDRSLSFPVNGILQIARERSKLLQTLQEMIGSDHPSGKVKKEIEWNQRFTQHLEGSPASTFRTLLTLFDLKRLEPHNFLESLQNYKKQLHVTSGGASS